MLLAQEPMARPASEGPSVPPASPPRARRAKRAVPPPGMLFEVIGDEATYMITEKAGNMIKAYPGYQDSLTAESITVVMRW